MDRAHNVKIGTIKIENIKALVVDGGDHEVLLGSDLFQKAFSVGKHDTENVSVSSPWKEDPTALSIELYPLEMPFNVSKFELYLKFQRRLYNVILISERGLKFSNTDLLNRAIESDEGLPEEFILQLSAIDFGSIWIGLKSGALATLRRLGSIFDTSATAKLAQQMADAKKAETQAAISEESRNATASHLIAEQEMLKAENICKTYETWRKEIAARVKFLDKMISQVSDEKTRLILVQQKDKAIIELASQQLLPMVRNIPRPLEPAEGVLLIGGPRTT